ncbi:MAG: hypothetical protein ACJAVI_002102 [Candidatus Azotimanducaceae bacterium]|jgi:hypothetical protein
MSDYFWYDIVGNVGVFFILLCYFLLQIKKMASDSLSYSVLNGLGASFILVSLIYDFNLSALIIELAWILISLFGVYKFYNHRTVVSGGSATVDGDSQ